MTTDADVTCMLAHADDGKPIDIHRPADPPKAAATVLLWHGIGPDERDILQPLAQETARQGAVVFVPDWRSDAPDGGRAHLLASLRFVREHAASYGGDADRLVLAGWSAGAGAAVGAALRPELFDGWRPTAVVGVAGRYDLVARTTGTSPADDLATACAPVPVWLVHGTRDGLVEVRHSREFHAALRDHGWPAQLEEPETDHAGVIMTAYAPEQGRCRPTRDEHALRGGRVTSRVLVRAATGRA